MDFKMDQLSGIAGIAILGTIFGAVIRGWNSIKGFFSNCFRLFVIETKLEDDVTSQAILAYLLKEYKRSNGSRRVFGGRHDNLRDGKFGLIPYESFASNSLVFWHGWLPFWFVISQEKAAEKEVYLWGSKPKPKIQCSINFFRFTLNVEQIIKNATAARNHLYWANQSIDAKNKRFYIRRIPDGGKPMREAYSVGTSLAWYYEGVYRLLSHSPDELGKKSTGAGKAMKQLFFPAYVDKMVQEVELWRSLREWYEERAIPWKRGWLLYGPPGTGKSAIIRAIAEDLDMPLFVFALGRLLDEELEKSWTEMQAHIPCVALFEDFDNVFHGRTNVYGQPNLSEQIKVLNVKEEGQKNDSITNTGKLSFDCLLNCIDGVEKSGGIFTVITTNHIDKLDPALGQPRLKEDGSMEFISTRPGRIDKAIELTYMTTRDKVRLARRIFINDKKGLERVKDYIRSHGNQETPAQFQERCAQMALEQLWSQQHYQKPLKLARV